MLTSSPASGDLFCVDLGMVIPAVFPMRRIEELPAMFDDRAGGAAMLFGVRGRLLGPMSNCRGVVVGQLQRAPRRDAAAQNRRPLVGSERRFLFGERCLRRGRSAAAGGRGRNRLHEGCRQRLSAEAHGHGVLLLCAGCAMSAWRSAKRCGDVLDKNISLNSARGQKSTLKNKGHRHLNAWYH